MRTIDKLVEKVLGNSTLLPLRVRQEEDVLSTVRSLNALMAPWEPQEIGRRLVIAPEITITAEELRKRVKGEAGGTPIPEWAHGSQGRLDRGLTVYRVRDAIYTPVWAAVIATDGSVLHRSVEETLYGTPTLAALPNVDMRSRSAVITIPETTRRIERGTVFCAAGGLQNYGHFLLDCMTTLLSISRQGLTESHPALVPGILKKWHRDLLSRMGEIGCQVEVTEQIIQVGDLLYASPMAHYLSYAGDLLKDLRTRMWRGEARGGRRIYFSRRGDTKREMTNEAQLERGLRERGFEIIMPETLSIDEQTDLMAGTSLLVGAVSAGFANCLFMPSGARIVEIQPSNYLQSWVRAMCDVLGMEWYPFFCQSPNASNSIIIEGEERWGTFSFELPLERFFAFLDRAVARPCGRICDR
jgi:capsular polysaccharide biosynthesis protein